MLLAERFALEDVRPTPWWARPECQVASVTVNLWATLPLLIQYHMTHVDGPNTR